ncbi:MAG: hypothetical protein ABL932_25605, partial [Terricaulis sp.]
SSALVIAAVYAVLYGVLAWFGMRIRLNGLRSYWASVSGLVLGFGFVAAMGSAAYAYAFSGWGYIALTLCGLAAAMTAINVLLVRTKEGARISFIQGFILQLVPNILMIAHALATRPT